MASAEGNGGPGRGPVPSPEPRLLTRREALRDGTVVSVALMLAGPASTLSDIAVAIEPGRRAFLNDGEMETLRALVDRFIPGPPDDLDPGAREAGCAEAIDALLGAFRHDPPRIYAGAPFSDRGGARRNHFRRFLRLDRYEEKAWMLRIRGSRGRPGLEFNGPVKGWQRTYREGLAALDEAAGAGGFASLPGLARDLVLRGSDDARITELIDVAFPHTYEFMYGAPEYGGNRGLVSWEYTSYDGDVQPRGWTREEVEERPPSLARTLEELVESLDGIVPMATLMAIAPLGFPEAGHNVVVRSGGTLEGLRDQIRPIVEWAERGGIDGS